MKIKDNKEIKEKKRKNEERKVEEITRDEDKAKI